MCAGVASQRQVPTMSSQLSACCLAATRDNGYSRKTTATPGRGTAAPLEERDNMVAHPPPFPVSLGHSSQFLFGTFVFGYVLFQKKMLPKSWSRVAARVYFWPTLPFTLGLRRGKLLTAMDAAVLVGVAPVAFGMTEQNLVLTLFSRTLCYSLDGFSCLPRCASAQALRFRRTRHHQPV